MSDKFAFNAESARRIADAVRQVEGNRGASRGPAWNPVQAETSDPFALGKTTSEWLVGEKATIDLYAGELGEEENTGDTLEDCVNKFGDIPSGRFVMLANHNGGWYVIAARC